MGAIQEEENMVGGEENDKRFQGGGAGRTTPSFSTETRPRPKVEAATPEGATIQSDAQGNIEIHPPAVGNEKTLQMVIAALTLIAVVTIGVSAYNDAIDAQTVVASVISGMAGLLGGQALRK